MGFGVFGAVVVVFGVVEVLEDVVGGRNRSFPSANAHQSCAGGWQMSTPQHLSMGLVFSFFPRPILLK